MAQFCASWLLATLALSGHHAGTATLVTKTASPPNTAGLYLYDEVAGNEVRGRDFFNHVHIVDGAQGAIEPRLVVFTDRSASREHQVTPTGPQPVAIQDRSVSVPAQLGPLQHIVPSADNRHLAVADFSGLALTGLTSFDGVTEANDDIEFSLEGRHAFTMSDDGSTVVAITDHPTDEFLELLHIRRAGVDLPPVAVPAVHDSSTSREGDSILLRTREGLVRLDGTGDRTDSEESVREFRADPTHEFVAAIDADRVRFLDENLDLVQELPTRGRAVDVRFGPGRLACVLEKTRFRALAVGAQQSPFFEHRIHESEYRYESMDIVARPNGEDIDVALGSLRVENFPTADSEGSARAVVEVFYLRQGTPHLPEPVTRFDPFPTGVWGPKSPEVQFVGGNRYVYALSRDALYVTPEL